MEYKCLICGEEFQTRYLLRKHRDLTKHLAKGKHPIYICECKFCKRQFNRKFSKTLHEKTCLLNPERKNVKGHKVSEETKKKISNGMKKAHKEGRANEWQGRTKRSYAEQSWYNIFSNDIGEKTFVNNYFVKKYWLDFAWTDKKIYFEVDGRTHFTESGILHDKERTEFLLNEGWTCIGRCNWSQYQKLSREDKEKYIQEIEKKIIEWVNV